MVKVDGTDAPGSLIRVRNLNKKYQRGSETIEVLQGLNLDVAPGEFVAFMGPSGSGKTTLLNLLGGIDVPTKGTVTVDGDEITKMSRRKLSSWRARHVGFIFQMYNLIPVLTAAQNVELPLLLTGLVQVKATPARGNGADSGRPRRPDEALSRGSFPAARSSGSPSLAPSSPTPPSCCATSPPVISTDDRRRRSSIW